MNENEPTESESAATGLFTGAEVHDLFNRLHELMPSTAMAPSSAPYDFPDGEPFELPATHEFGGQARDTAEFLVDGDTAALLVLQNGAVRHEYYALTGGRDVQWISWSVAKSFVSALVGIAVSEGLIASVDDPINRYAPGLDGTAYDGVRIEDVLQMSSGARWIEDYSDPTSDVHRLGAVNRGEITLDEFMAGMVREFEPATLCRYNSADTQALGMLLAGATGRSIADYMHQKLIEPLGMESTSHWLTDTAGMEQAFGGLMVTARDFAKIGELYRRGGDWHGTQIVPADWVRQSLVFDKPHLHPGKTMIGGEVLPTGYGYQWWLYPGDRGDYSAIGIYNQHVYVDPPSGAVIVKLSANRTYGLSHKESDNKSGQNYALFQAIAAALG
ncbi:MAG: serine hydrolase [Actinomycetota bacterium]